MERRSTGSKSRGGCTRCKQRRIKCDETKPACQMCHASRMHCPGYEKTLRWMTSKHQQQLQLQADIAGCKTSRPSRTLRHGIQRPPPLTPRSEDWTSEVPLTDVSSSPAPSTARAPTATEDAVLPDASFWPTIDAWDFEDFGLFNMPLLDHNAASQISSAWLRDLNPTFMFDTGRQHPTSNAALTEDFGSEHCDIRLSEDMDTHSDREGTFALQDPRHTDASTGNFLRTYYRLSVPHQVSGLSDDDFINHFFQNVCSIFSCFDSDHNPLRSLVAAVYQHSDTIHTAIQCLAIGHLANYYPQLASLGLKKRSRAWQLLQRDIYAHRIGKLGTDTLLLALLLLGISSSWHETSDTGVQYLLIARNTMLDQLHQIPAPQNESSIWNETFHQNAMMYWEILASFVDPVPITPLPGRLRIPKATRRSNSERVVAHPWTGLLVDLNYVLAEISRVVQRRRTQLATPTREGHGEHRFSASEKEWVLYLGSFLDSVEIPDENHIADYDDPKTPKPDLINAAEAYRLAGSLEIYAIFPDMSPDDNAAAHGHYHSAEHGHDHNEQLTTMALDILHPIQSIAISSGACRLLPILFMIAATYLRFPPPSSPPQHTPDERYESVLQARLLVEARMLLLSRKYPQNPLLQMLLVIKEVWQRLDDGDDSAHWMKVMHDKGWQTLMG